MCGIVGAVAPQPVPVKDMEAMRDTLTHRGPDHAGLWRSPEGRTCLAHRRLAIIDLLPEANQPFVSHDGRFVITFNGEIYNYRALRKVLEADGVRFRTVSDTEVLLEAWRRWGTDCLPRLSGMFAFAIWDGEHRELWCARDRTGEKPFYYAHCDGAFLFASELKALVRWPGFVRRIHPPALVDFLTFGFVADPRAIWEGCSKLPPGHSMRVRCPPDDRPRPDRPQPYWEFEFAPDPGRQDWPDQVRETLRAAADEMAVADVPVGTFLSGGVDSSAVTAALSLAGHEVRSFTIGFDEAAYDERAWARRVADRYQTSHTEQVVTPDDVATVFDRLLWHYDEPFGDYSYIPTFYLCQEARRAITVALSGDGGDELFAGYRRYQRLALRDRLATMTSPSIVRLAGRGGQMLSRHARRRMFGHYALAPDAALADMLTLGLSVDELRSACRGELAAALQDHTPRSVVHELLRLAPPDEVGLVNAMRFLDLKLTLAGGILTKVDRASMAVSLEVRPVFLHKAMLALAGRLPPGQLAGPTRAKYVLKRALEPWLPRDLLYRRKQGFALPLGRWLAGPANTGFVGHMGKRSADLIDPALGQRLLERHRSGQADCTAALHNLAVLDHWLQRWT